MTRALAILTALLWVSGCNHQPAPSPRVSRSVLPQSTRDNLDTAMNYLDRSNEFEEAQSSFQVAYCLNRWLDGQSVSGDWQPDPLVAGFPRDPWHRRVQDLGDSDSIWRT